MNKTIRVAIDGPSGAGKSTLVRCINLLDNSILHNNDSCPKCKSLCLVMSNVNNCCLKSLMKL